ncbi:ElaA protein [Caldalkalibacillus uzonensis]|uniref:ElaA protein n=1 Tax=Caldalkalibacillus uzonensis TaxID=353224 RepID=A0ABU0CTD3_9BACI|nr:GNAT family N-acetyltransferase [Caldalkalibacillus uzonensis]MDQ0339685.1 ElaA protein [Caldalkalibacillus uzonensis]
MSWTLKRFEELSTYELYRILQERVKIFVVEQECPYPEIDGHDLKAYHLYKEDNEEIAAYLRILPPHTVYPEASIGRVIVKKEHRGKGYAKEMLVQAINFIHRELGESTIKIQAQHYLEQFYGSFGFKTISDVYLEDGIPHVDMLLKMHT